MRRTTYARPGLLFRLVDRVPARLPLERGQTTRRQGHRTGPNSGPRGAASIPQRREHSSPTRTTIAAFTQEVVGLVGHPQSVRTIGANLVDRQSHPAAKTSAKAIAASTSATRRMLSPILSLGAPHRSGCTQGTKAVCPALLRRTSLPCALWTRTVGSATAP